VCSAVVTHRSVLCWDFGEQVQHSVVHQAHVAPVVVGHQEGDVVEGAVLPGGEQPLRHQVGRHGEVEAGIPDEEVALGGGAVHQAEEALLLGLQLRVCYLGKKV
jgi:hypothetical protein